MYIPLSFRPNYQYYSVVKYCKVVFFFLTGLQIRVRIGNLFSLFLMQNICCGYSKEMSQ